MPTATSPVRPINPLDARLGPLTDNGGPTETHASLADSPAINAGGNILVTDPITVAALTSDQPGSPYRRIALGRIHITAEGTEVSQWPISFAFGADFLLPQRRTIRKTNSYCGNWRLEQS